MDAKFKSFHVGNLIVSNLVSHKLQFRLTANNATFLLLSSIDSQGHPNVKAIHSSKAVGEPPFFLASSVFFAIKDAIMAARAETGHKEWFPLDSPATPERIRMACLDEFTTPFISNDYRPKQSV